MRSNTGLVALLAAGLFLAPHAASATVVNQLFPGSGGGSYVIVVVADGYTDAARFTSDAKFLFVTRLMVDPFFAAHASSFTIKTVFDAAPASGASLFGISTTNRSSCDFAATPAAAAATAAAINAAATKADPNPQYVALLTDDSVSYACTTADHWTYVTSGASDRRGILAHELGHLIAGLYDEWDDGVTPYSGSAINRSNCSTKLPPQSPYWVALPRGPGVAAPTNPPGCRYAVSGIVRPYATCKMRDYELDQLFCAVCRREMEAVLGTREAVPSAPTAPTGIRIIKAAFVQPPPTPVTSAVRLVIRVDAGSGQSTVLAATEVPSARIVQRRIGDVVYAVTENGQTLATGVFPGDPFEARIYDRTPKHTTATARAATLVVLVPQSSVRTLMTRAVQVTFYRVGTSDPDPVTPDKLRSLLGSGNARSISVLAPATLNERLKALYP